MKDKSAEELLKHFKFKDKKKVLQKLEKLINDGKDKLHLIVDFDRTLTIGRSDGKQDITSWNIIKAHLPPAGLKMEAKYYSKYRLREIDGTITTKEQELWASKTAGLFVEHKINIIEVEKDFQQKANISPGAKTLFELCKTSGIPITIISAGIKEVIDIWTKTYQVIPDLILATRLITDSKGTITGLDKKNLIHLFNKKQKLEKRLKKLVKDRSNIIVVGDALEDADMIDGDENVLRIRINDPRIDQKYKKVENNKRTFEKFDLMIESGTLEPVLKILELIK